MTAMAERGGSAGREGLARLVLVTSVLAGTSYMAAWSLGLPHPAITAWKGAGVALLAVYAALKARDADGWLICAVMAFGPWATCCWRPPGWWSERWPSWWGT
jgi:uncharacterized membrane protein YhhN